MARDFARAMQRLAKTDRIDAATLAEFAAVLAQRPHCERFVRPLSEPEQQDLAALVTRRRQLVAMQLSERQRLCLARPVTRPSIDALLEALARQLDNLDAEPDLRLGGRGPLRQRLRVQPRPTTHPRRALRGATCPVHGHAHRHTIQPRHSRLLPASGGRRQAQENGLDRLHAQAHHPPQRHYPGPSERSKSASHCLTFNTVTHVMAATYRFRYSSSPRVIEKSKKAK